jgi:type IV pilus assembly protein PilC
MDEALGPLSVFGSVILGIALLWSVRLVYGNRRDTSDDALRLVLTIAGWTLIHLSVISIVAQVFSGAPNNAVDVVAFMFIVTIMSGVALTVFAMVVGRFRVLEWRSLMWSLAAGAERGIPLEQIARAFACERTDEIGLRASRLANYLEGGTPLPDALALAKTTVPIDGLLAARYGMEMGNLGPAIARIAKRQSELEQVMRSVFEKVFYLFLVGSIMMNIIAFMMFKIVPVFAQMFDEFALELPPTTLIVVYLSDVTVSYFIFVIPLFFLTCAFFLIGGLHYVGWLPRDFPLVNLLSRRYDGALVMRTLGLAAEEQRPFSLVIATLARVYPKRSVRAALDRAGRRIESGEPWTECLRQTRIIGKADARVLEAAERTGNIGWALEEMADSRMRRWVFKLRIVLNVLFPLLVLVMGVIVGFLVYGLFAPLVALIDGLAK